MKGHFQDKRTSRSTPRIRGGVGGVVVETVVVLVCD